MDFHPLSTLFPLMQGREFDELVEDIRTHGQREPIWVITDECPRPGEHKCYAYDEPRCDLEAGDGVWHCRYCDHNPALIVDRILDGRNRWRACQLLGIEPYIEIYDGEDPLAFVVSLNLHRRHLDESQRALVAANLANMQQGERTDLPSANLQKVSQSRAAELLNVSPRTVAMASKVKSDGAPELVAAVETGRVSVSAAADVAALPKDEQREIVAKGEKQILEAAKQIRARKADERRDERLDRVRVISAGNAELNVAQRYPVIYADPPWRYDYTETEARAIENQYPTMDLDAICRLPVRQLSTEDAVLFLWGTSPKLVEALSVVEAWGFTYRTCAVWHKPQIGMGYYFRQQHELLLVATRGNLPAPAPANRIGSVITADRTAHSAKPVEFSEAIERMYPTLPKIELFCRAPRDGWAVWGNQSAA